jgi:WD40 repeat protein
MQMTLHPDNRRIVLRRSSGQQPIEIYDLNTGLLERTIYPAIQDPAGNHLFALTKDGGEILSDFERFATDSGETLQQDLTLSVGFSDYAFSQDGERLITLRGNEWWVWDIKSSTVIRKETIRLRGNVVDVSPDADRYLTQRQSGDQLIMEITDIGSELRKSAGIDTLGRRLIDVSASPDWSRFLAIYQNGDVAIYDLEAGRLQYIAYDDLPVSGSRSYGWIDNDSAYVMSQGGGGPGVRLYGADYHVTGLPNCIVEAYPDTWEELLPLWERFSVNLGGERLTRLALTICNNLPETTGALVESLTPTPGPR